MKLNQSEVIFNQEAHTYTLNGVQLQGITGMLSRQLFPNKYSGIPESILKRAAEKGSLVHEACELIDELGVTNDMPEAKAYEALKEKYRLNHVASEYLVTDNEHFASAIDKVYEVEGGVALGDVKTTYHLDKEYVRWQLSIYAYLFELMNPGIKVVELFAIWLRGDKGERVDVERIPQNHVVELMACEINGQQYTNPLPEVHMGDLPVQYRELEAMIVEIDSNVKEWEEKKKSLIEGISAIMDENNVVKWSGERVTFTRKAATVRRGFDAKRFKEDYPELYAQYETESEVKPSLLIKIK